MKPIKQIVLLFSIVALLFSCKNENNTTSEGAANTTSESTDQKTGQAFIEDEGGVPNALQLAIQSKDHSTLVAAVQAAGVENALVNVGPLTVFAPNNEGFAKIDEATLNDLLLPENKSKLAFILTHHVAPSNYPVETLKKNAEKNRKLYMASGKYLEVTEKDGNLYIDGNKILGTVNVSNGWVHVLDNVMLPKD